jgi:hypothetical protein
VRLRIDHIAVELAEDARVEAAEATLRASLELLALRLSAAPLSGGEDVRHRALELIEIGPVTSDWLAGPGAASRLADELYMRIARAR